jgi:hypothetical protein
LRVSISRLARDTISFFIPGGAILNDFNTDIFPFGTAFVTLDASSCFLVPIFAVQVHVRGFFVSPKHPNSFARYTCKKKKK